MFFADPNTVDQELANYPQRHPTRAADEVGQWLQAAAEAAGVAEVPLDRLAQAVQRRAERQRRGVGPFEQLDGVQPTRLVIAAVAQARARLLARRDQLEPARRHIRVKRVAVV